MSSLLFWWMFRLGLGLYWWKYFKGKTFNLNPFQVSTLKGLDSHYGTKGLRKVTNFIKIVWHIHYFENWINISRWQLTATMGERWLSSSATQLATTMAPRWKMGRFQRLFFTPKIPIVKRDSGDHLIFEKRVNNYQPLDLDLGEQQCVIPLD